MCNYTMEVNMNYYVNNVYTEINYLIIEMNNSNDKWTIRKLIIDKLNELDTYINKLNTKGRFETEYMYQK